ncbi:Polyisoprenoid-binding protein YceI [Hyunsoonleella jejuensis]|uniref:Polyisoprenoid-binding protein YceI n=1 Tax=Hyunsoonleella jejuensis TaxID=419940 RepID=A0A1H9FV62_9FLAO|nr:YceI family protein [Hyunsoonleella jejuensis]SEQ41443.1 Polyisoprenoid-binding protein YceI [Hyunsoonleella jejuensis]
MNSKFKMILFMSAFALALVGCKDKAKEAQTSDAEAAAEAKATAVKYVADAESSSIEWKGFKPTGTHNGTIKLSSGVVNVSDGAVESGSFIVDMGSINVLDIPAEDEQNGKLAGHLKSADFFDVEQFPNAAFEITGISEVEGKTMLSGNLTLKDVKNNITFPVTVSENGETMTLSSETFTIDRSKWNVQYGSKSFFDNLGDKFINDDIELKVNVTAKKA